MAKNTNKDSRMAADLKARGVERTVGRCANCYRMVSCEGPKSRYTHMCRG